MDLGLKTDDTLACCHVPSSKMAFQVIDTGVWSVIMLVADETRG